MNSFVVKQSKIDRRGLIANQDIKKGDVLFRVEGPVIRYAFEPDYRAGANWLQIKQNIWKMPLRKSPWNFINHSCQPNAGLQGINAVVTIRDVSKGEEITIDYSTVEAGRRWRMNCKCGESSCRKVIRSIWFLPRKTFLAYETFVPKHLHKLYFQEKTYHVSAGNRKALFAKHPLKTNEIICSVEGPTIAYKFPPDYHIGYHWLAVGKNKWIVPLRHNPWAFIRHSCEPNVGLNNNNQLVAMRSIDPDEELTIDDSTTEADIKWKRKCSCKKKTCRKIIRSVQFLDEQLYKRYKLYMSSFIKNEYLKHHKAKNLSV